MNREKEKLIAFFRKHKKISYPRGRTIINSQDSPSGVYYVQKGFVKDYSISENGKNITLILFKEGDIFPYSWVFNNIPNTHSFEAFTDCILLRAPKDEFIEFLTDNSDVLLMVIQIILLRLRGLIQRLEDVTFGSAQQRVASIFAILAERFGTKHEGGILISIPLAHKDIAELVGLTRETASIEIKRLEGKNIISRKSRWYVVKNYKSLLKNLPQAPQM